MAGGLFSGYPFAPNWKCVIFTMLVAGGYWTLPPKSLFVLLVLAIVPYIAMAWYDYKYNCSRKLKPTLIPYGRTLFLPFKDPEYKAAFSKLPKEAIRDMDTLDHITTYILVIGVGAWFLWPLSSSEKAR